MKVKKENGEFVEIAYDELCHNFGFVPDSRFVVVRRGVISWSAGKDHEILSLKKACLELGYRTSKALRDFK